MTPKVSLYIEALLRAKKTQNIDMYTDHYVLQIQKQIDYFGLNLGVCYSHLPGMQMLKKYLEIFSTGTT